MSRGWKAGRWALTATPFNANTQARKSRIEKRKTRLIKWFESSGDFPLKPLLSPWTRFRVSSDRDSETSSEWHLLYHAMQIKGRFGNVVSDDSFHLVAFFSFFACVSFSFTRNKRERNEGTVFILKRTFLWSLFLFWLRRKADCEQRLKGRALSPDCNAV